MILSVTKTETEERRNDNAHQVLEFDNRQVIVHVDKHALPQCLWESPEEPSWDGLSAATTSNDSGPPPPPVR
jgi:hypothetical protein